MTIIRQFFSVSFCETYFSRDRFVTYNTHINVAPHSMRNIRWLHTTAYSLDCLLHLSNEKEGAKCGKCRYSISEMYTGIVRVDERGQTVR